MGSFGFLGYMIILIASYCIECIYMYIYICIYAYLCQASLTGLYEVGRKHAELGFSAPVEEGMRVVLMSTDDYFKLGASLL